MIVFIFMSVNFLFVFHNAGSSISTKIYAYIYPFICSFYLTITQPACHLAYESRLHDNVSSECDTCSGRKVMRNYNSSDILRFGNMVSRRVINCEIQMDGKREKNAFCACSKRTTFEVIMAPSKRFRPIPWQSFVIY